MKIKISWLDDESDCETCGLNFAEGAVVTFEDGRTVDMTPVAYCFSATSYSAEDVYKAILKELGHEVEEDESSKY